ncbi:MAG: S8 family serine peptidase [Candidatus Bathyarchaeia archaeon]
MKKISITAAFMLVLMLMALGPFPARAEPHKVKRSLDFDVLPFREELIDAVDFSATTTTIDKFSDPTPFWVDIVDAEGYNGGEGVYVAVLDTGLLSNWQFLFAHPLTGECRIKAEWGKGFTHDIWWNDTIGDFVIGPLRDDRGFITKAFEGSGHGTHVTSTIIGYRFRTATADFWVRGIAPKATIIPVLVLDAWEVPYPGGTARFTGGTDEMVAAGIKYVAWLAETYGVKIIINMSLGGSEPSPTIEEAINYAISKGVIIVAAAGNDGEAGMNWPGAYPKVISVSAGGWTEQWITKPPQTRWWLNDVPEKLNTKDYWRNNWQIYLEEFSSRPNASLGQFWKDLDVCAPGASIVGPYKSYFSTTIGYYHLWGTSMATPHVSAVAALVAEKYPQLKQADVEWILKSAASMLPLASDGAYILDPWGFWYYKWNDHDYGSGWLQADNALQVASTYVRGRTKAKAYVTTTQK